MECLSKKSINSVIYSTWICEHNQIHSALTCYLECKYCSHNNIFKFKSKIQSFTLYLEETKKMLSQIQLQCVFCNRII